MTLLVRRASVQPGCERDLVVRDGRLVTEPAPADAEVVEADGRPVLPGLADHHVHLFALAAAWASVDVGPAALAAGGGLDAVLRRARRLRPDGWLRAVGYDVAASGPLDRRRLDAAGVGPVRVQDRTGILWVLDSVGLAAVLPDDAGTESAGWPEGVVVDPSGRPTGVLRRLDGWLRGRLPDAPPDVAAVGRWLAARGVTSVTDAGAHNGPDELARLAAAALPQRVTAMTGDPDCPAVDGVALGPVKVVLDEADLPALDDLAALVARAHDIGRSVAVHCVDRASLVLALAAGVGPQDRIEHASLVGADLLTLLTPTVVTQPGLVRARGDRYLAEVPPEEHADLYRLRSLLDAGVRVAAGSDAPYGPADPWDGVAAAVDRRPLGPQEAVDADAAIRLLAGYADRPAVPRTLDAGRPGDLVVLDDDWDRLACHPAVACTVVDGRVVWRKE